MLPANTLLILTTSLVGFDAPPAPGPNEPDAAAIRKAVEKSLPLLAKGAEGHITKRTCFACHNQSMAMLSFVTARERGFTVREGDIEKQSKFIADFLASNRDNYRKGQGQGGQADMAGYALLTLEWAGWKADQTTEAVVDYLLLRNSDINHWRTSANRPPSEVSPFTTTFVALRGLHRWGLPAHRERIARRIDTVRGWLLKTSAKDTEDRVFRLLALKEAGAEEPVIRKAADELAKTQRKDGGWGQTDTMDSDAYATGSTLFALHQTGGLSASDTAYRRGLAYLLKEQKEDGSWLVRSRSKPFQTYYESGFPHGKDQFISMAGSGWATAALLLALPIQKTALPVERETKWLSHPALRPLPSPANRARGDGPGYFVDPLKGDDRAEGSEKTPWRTINHALKQLKPGDTLYLRGGVHHESVYCAVAGKKDAPITIRSFPGEQAIIDGGMREFLDEPAKAWEPYPKGGEGEYRSVRAYRNIRDVVGLFGDSHVGLQTYWHARDLRAKNELWIDDPEKKSMVLPVYCGPGLWYDKETGHIHVRLAHTHLEHPQVANYRGETDPRKLPLVIAAFNATPLLVDQAMHVRFQDLVIRGGGFNSVVLQHGVNLEFDNVTIFGGTYVVRSRGTGPLKMTHCGVHGNIPPWGWRTENGLYTYTARTYDPFVPPDKPDNARNIARLPTHAVLVTEGSYEFEVFHYPYNHDWDISYCDFSEGHDGVYLSGRNIRFHHNHVDNMQDDGIYLSAPSPFFNDDIHIYQNLITRCLMAFSCHSQGGPTGKIAIYRNIADLRQGVLVGRPDPKNKQGTLNSYHIFLVHGRELLGIESISFYQNTFVSPGLANSFVHRTWVNTTERTQRRVFNNLCVYLNHYPSLDVASAPKHDIQLDGNLHWCPLPDAKVPEKFLERVRSCPASEVSKTKYPPGWAANDVVGDPLFERFGSSPEAPADYRLRKDSPARAKGVILPGEMEDPLRPGGGARPDIGAIPVGSDPPRVGRQGRSPFPLSWKAAPR